MSKKVRCEATRPNDKIRVYSFLYDPTDVALELMSGEDTTFGTNASISDMRSGRDSVTETIQSWSSAKKAKQAMIGLIVIAVLLLIAVVIWIIVEFTTQNAYMEPPSAVVYTAGPNGTWTSVATFANYKSEQVLCRGRGDVVETCTRMPRPVETPTPLITLSLTGNAGKPTSVTVHRADDAAPAPPANGQPTTIVVGGVKPEAAALLAVIATTGDATGAPSSVAAPPKSDLYEGPGVVSGAPVQTGPAALPSGPSGPAVPARAVAAAATMPPGPGAPFPATTPAVPTTAAGVAAALSSTAGRVDAAQAAAAANPNPPLMTPIALPVNQGTACNLNPNAVNQVVVLYKDAPYDNFEGACVPRQYAAKRLMDAESEGFFDVDEPDCAVADGVFDIPSVAQRLGRCGPQCGPGEVALDGLEAYDMIPCEDNLVLGLTNATRRSANDVVPIGAENWIDQDQETSRHEQLTTLQLGGFLPFQMVKRSDTEPLDNLPFSYNPMEGTPGPGAFDDFNVTVQTETPGEKLSNGTFRRAIVYGTKNALRTSKSSDPNAKYAAAAAACEFS